MSRSWDPWRLSTENQVVIPTPVLTPFIGLPGEESGVNKGENNARQHSDFISFLALAQHLDVDFLPITWHPAVETLGAGATAEIRQALVDIQTSFAFKRIGLERKDAFRALASEVSVLRSSEVNQHDNIIKLVGICWDVDHDGPTIWPVLVFEKAPHGSLKDFMRSDLGRQLSVSQMLSMMRDIGRALASLHRNDILHCDIKPENLLVFQHDTNNYFIKVADFGYASPVTGTGSIHLATPEAWTDPTYRGEPLDVSTAKKMESYSYGLVCAWLLRQAGINKLSQTLAQPTSYTEQSENLEELFSMLTSIPNLNSGQILNLKKFFSSTLAANRDDRNTDFSQLVLFLEDTNNIITDGKSSPNAEDHSSPTVLFSGLDNSIGSTQYKFQISKSLFRLLKADFRLPGFIARQLYQQAKMLSDGDSRSNAQFQLAVCYAIGFGVRRSLEHSRQWLSTCGKSDKDLEVQIEILRAENKWPYQSRMVKALETAGSLDILDPRFTQDAEQILKESEKHYREEMQDFEQVFSPAHSVMVLTRFLLGNVLNKAGRYEEAYDIYVDLGKTMEQTETNWGPLHRSTLITWTQAAVMAFKLGKDAKAGSLYQKVFEGQTITLGPLHTETLYTADALALVLKNQGKYREAQKLSRDAFEGRKRVFGDEHPDTLASMSNLSTILVSMGDFQEAKPLLEKCVHAQKRIFGKGNGDTMICQSNLSALHNLMGNLSEAEKLADEVLQEMEEVLGFNHPDAFYVQGNLASTMHAMGKNDKARELGNRLLQQKHLIGIDNPYHLTVMSNMALMLQEEGLFEESLKLDREILQGRIQLLGEDHPETLLTRNNIAAALQMQGKYSEAKEIYEEVLRLGKDVLGENHPATIDTNANLANLLQQMGHYDSALIMHKDTVKRSVETLGSEHPHTLMSKSNLGSLYLLLGNTAEAVDLFRQTIEARLKLLGESHPHTLQSMDNLAVGLLKLGQNQEAEKYFRWELQNEIVLGSENLIILNARNNLGMQLSTEGRREEARECIEKALAGREKRLGLDHPDTVTSLYNMAWVDFDEAKYGPAIDRFRIVVEKRTKILGVDHPDTLHSMKTLAEALSRDGRYAEGEKLDRETWNFTKQKYGDSHPNSLAASLRLALALQRLGRLDEAEKILVGVVEAGSQEKNNEAHQLQSSRYYLARVRDALGKYNEAEVDLRYVLKQREQDLGVEHNDTLQIVNLLGLVVRNLGRLDEAFELLDRALKGRKKIAGNESQIYETLALQALVRQDQGNLVAAKQLNEQALAGWESLLGLDHPITLGVVNNLASLTFQQHDGPETLRLHRRVMAGREKVLGSSHPDTIESIRAMGAVNLSIGSEKEAMPLFERAYSSICQLYGPDDPRSKEIEEEMSLVRELIDEKMDNNDQKPPDAVGSSTLS